MHTTISMWRSEGNSREFVIAFYHMGPGNFNKSGGKDLAARAFAHRAFSPTPLQNIQDALWLWP